MLITFVNGRRRAGNHRLDGLIEVSETVDSSIVPILALFADDLNEHDLRIVDSSRKPDLIRGIPQRFEFRGIRVEHGVAHHGKAAGPTVLTNHLHLRIFFDLVDFQRIAARDKPQVAIIIHSCQRHRPRMKMRFAATVRDQHGRVKTGEQIAKFFLLF